MAKFTVSMSCDNAAFQDIAPAPEIARILAELSGKLADGSCHDEGKLRDINGNVVGSWVFSKADQVPAVYWRVGGSLIFDDGELV